MRSRDERDLSAVEAAEPLPEKDEERGRPAMLTSAVESGMPQVPKR